MSISTDDKRRVSKNEAYSVPLSHRKSAEQFKPFEQHSSYKDFRSQLYGKSQSPSQSNIKKSSKMSKVSTAEKLVIMRHRNEGTLDDYMQTLSSEDENLDPRMREYMKAARILDR